MAFSIPETIKAQIKAQAILTPDREVCGYWVPSSGSIIPAKNLHPDPENFFQIDGDYHVSIITRYQDAIIYHSHVKESTPSHLSHNDIECSKRLRVPYITYHTQYNEWDYFDPSDLNPYPLIDRIHPPSSLEFYLGIPWQWNRWDCYSLFRAYYKGRLGIVLKDYSRLGDEDAISSTDWNQYIDNYKSQGFISIPIDSKLCDNDVLLMTLIGDRIHHALIVVDEAKSIGLHITGEDKVSKLVYIGDSIMRRTKMIIRHKNFA